MNLFRHTSTRRARVAASHEISPEDVFLDSQNVSNMDLNQMEGQLERPLGKHVFYITVAITVLFICGFAGRLFAMQILNGKEYADKADRNHLKSTPIFALRGTISDRNGTLLAWNTTGMATSSTSTTEIPMRSYIETSGFSHLLGYVSYPKKDSSGIFWQEEYIGKDGVEKQYQSILQGVPGERVIAVNAHQEVEAENVTIDPTHGENIKLTIDSGVQAKLYERISALARDYGYVSGAGVIMDVQTGEILALASYPEYDNNLMTNAKTKEDSAEITSELQDKRHAFLNRVVSGLFTPGSTVKPFMALAALMEGVITPEKQILSTGALVIKNKYGGPDSVFKDWKAHGYVDMRDAIAVSSDEYFYQIGGGYLNQKGIGIDKINAYSNMFGFATTTGVDLPGEAYGNVPSQEWKKRVFGEDWILGNTYHTVIGQYGFQITPLELARAVASLANGGRLVTPHVLEGLETTQTELEIPDKDLKVIKEGMRQGVTQGIGGVLKIEGVPIASKSGTAELGVKKDLVNSWISGFFPYDNPKYVFVVIMEKGSVLNTHGAIFAARETIEWMRDNTDYTK
jgi:penicillin-binding protein 2